MKIELRSNGEHQIILTPETELETVMLKIMAESAEKGRAVSLKRTFDSEGDGQIKQVSIGVPA